MLKQVETYKESPSFKHNKFKYQNKIKMLLTEMIMHTPKQQETHSETNYNKTVHILNNAHPKIFLNQKVPHLLMQCCSHLTQLNQTQMES